MPEKIPTSPPDPEGPETLNGLEEKEESPEPSKETDDDARETMDLLKVKEAKDRPSKEKIDERIEESTQPESEEKKELISHEEERFKLPDIEKAKEENYSWVETAEKSREFLSKQILDAEDILKKLTEGVEEGTELYKQIQEAAYFRWEERQKKGESGMPEEDFLAAIEDFKKLYQVEQETLNDKWQRLKILSSEREGSGDEELNKRAYEIAEKSREEGEKISDIECNDRAREELLESLIKETVDEETKERAAESEKEEGEPVSETPEEEIKKEEEEKLEKIREEIKEKTLEEALKELEEKREIYVDADKGYKDAKKKEKTGLGLAEIKLEEARLEYEKIKTEYGRRLYREKLESLERQGITEAHPRFEEEMALLKAALFEDLIIIEQDALAKAKVDAFEPRERSLFEKMIISYARMPMWKKVLISTGVVTGAMIAGGAVGGGIAALIFGTGRFVRGMVAGKLAALSGTLVKSVGTRKVEEWRQREVEKLREGFNAEIATEAGKEGDEFQNMIRGSCEGYEEIVKKTNKKHRNVTYWSIGTGIAVGGTAALTTGHLDGALADVINQKLGLAGAAAGPVAAAEVPSHEVPTPAEASPEAPPEISVEAPVQESLAALEIGNRGPEGVIIDYLKHNPDIARDSFGWDGETNLDRWAGIKAHQLWLEDAGEQLKNPATLEQLKELGYSQDLKGFAEMMRRIGEGNVRINPDGTIDLENMEYLRARVPEIGARIPKAEAFPTEEVTRPTINVPEGTTHVPYTEGELIVTREGNDISYFFNGEKFAEGTVHDDGTYYIPMTKGSIDPAFCRAYSTTRLNLEVLGRGEEMQPDILGGVKESIPVVEGEPSEKLLLTEIKGVNLETKSALDDLIYKTPIDVQAKIIKLAELVRDGKIKIEDLVKYYTAHVTGERAETVSPTLIKNLESNFDKVVRFQDGTLEAGEGEDALMSIRALEILFLRLLKE